MSKKLNQRTFDPGTDFFPMWTPNGSLVYAHNDRRRGATLRWQRAGGDGTSESLDTAGLPSGVTSDGRLVFSQGEGGTPPGGARDVMIMALDRARQVKGLVQTAFAERNGVVSPDGHWLAYESDRAESKFEIYVEPFPNVGAKRWKLSTAGGTKPLWAPSGRELFFVNADGAIMAAGVDTRGGTWNATGNPTKVVERGLYLTRSDATARTYDVSTDGQRFLVIKPVRPVVPPQIIVWHHWAEELKRLVPAN